MIFKISYISLLIVGCVRSFVLPLDKCHLEDSSCMKKAFQKVVPIYFAGIPEQGIEVQDPLKMDYIKFDLSGLQFSLKESRLMGLKNAIIDDVKWDLKKKVFRIVLYFDGTLTGKYTSGGKIIILSTTGDGDLILKFKNLKIQLSVSYEIAKGEDGKDHVVLKKPELEFEVRGNMNFNFTNSLNTNKEESDEMSKFLNENWQQITAEFGKPISEAGLKSIFKYLAIFFKKNAIGDIVKI